MMFYHNKTTVVYKLIGCFIYQFIVNFICLDYLGILQRKLSSEENKFWKTKFNDLSGLGIPEILMNIMPCHGFSKLTTSTVILTCHSAFVPYYWTKRVFIVEKYKFFLWIYQNEFSSKSIILYHTIKTDFWRVKQHFHKMFKIEQDCDLKICIWQISIWLI